ncbi:MAG: preprotein translocase subunit SecE [Dehalococcoidia bacterium]|nr:preprotein translocase subunit SecE [Dehalococcoidia bacterium]
MSRALRRHPVTSKQGRQRGRPPAIRPAGRRPQRETREGRGLLGTLRPRWAEDIIGELRKVTWPSREDTWYLTFVVLVVAIAFGVFLGGVDMFFNWAIENTLLR